MTHLLDTDHLTILQYPTSHDYRRLAGHMNRHPPGYVAACVVSVHEQTRGVHNQITKARKSADVVAAYDVMSRIVRVITPLPLLPFDDPAAAVFDQLKAQKVRVGTMDLRFAAIALSRNLVHATRNARDFGQVLGLHIEDWTK